jgi:hypothetical protein
MHILEAPRILLTIISILWVFLYPGVLYNEDTGCSDWHGAPRLSLAQGVGGRGQGGACSNMP